jgi:hypothetical protein
MQITNQAKIIDITDARTYQAPLKLVIPEPSITELTEILKKYTFDIDQFSAGTPIYGEEAVLTKEEFEEFKVEACDKYWRSYAIGPNREDDSCYTLNNFFNDLKEAKPILNLQISLEAPVGETLPFINVRNTNGQNIITCDINNYNNPQAEINSLFAMLKKLEPQRINLCFPLNASEDDKLILESLESAHKAYFSSQGHIIKSPSREILRELHQA